MILWGDDRRAVDVKIPDRLVPWFWAAVTIGWVVLLVAAVAVLAW